MSKNRQSLAVEHSLNWDVVCSLEQLTVVAAQRGLDELGAWLAGAAHARRRDIGLVVDLFTDPEMVTATHARLRSSLGTRFDERWESGGSVLDACELLERAEAQLREVAQPD